MDAEMRGGAEIRRGREGCFIHHERILHFLNSLQIFPSLFFLSANLCVFSA